MGLSLAFKRMRMAAFASVAKLEAVEPEMSRQRSIYINGEHTPITEGRVRDVLGDEAAKDWVALQAATSAFNAAADRAIAQKGEA